MAIFYRTRVFRGKEYVYKEERWREGRKMRSRSTYIGPASTVYAPKVGPHDAERAHHERNILDLERRLAETPRYRDTFEHREWVYRTGHPSASYRAKAEYIELRERAQAEAEAEKAAPVDAKPEP